MPNPIPTTVPVSVATLFLAFPPHMGSMEDRGTHASSSFPHWLL